MILLAIDPGTTESAYVVYYTNPSEGPPQPINHGKVPNEEMRKYVALRAKTGGADALAIEMVASYGMPVGKEVFETVLWTGIFAEAWSASMWGSSNIGEIKPRYVYRRDVKLHLCGTVRAKDANVRQALLDRYGGKSAVGTKKAPGPLYGISGDVWAALGVAVTAAETESTQ